MKSFFRTPDKGKQRALILGDLFFIALSLITAFYLQMSLNGGVGAHFLPIRSLPLLPKILAIINLLLLFGVFAALYGGSCLLVFYVAGLYEIDCIFFKKKTALKIGMALLPAQVFGVLLSQSIFNLRWPLLIWCLHLGSLFLLLWSWRYLFFRKSTSRGPFKVLVVGDKGQDLLAQKAVESMCSNGVNRFFRFSYCSLEGYLSGPALQSSNGGRPDLIVYPFGKALPEELMASLVRKKFEGVGICNSLTFYKNSTGSFPAFDLDPQWLINLSISLSLTKKLQQRIKRVLDIVFSLLLVLLCSPLLILIPVLIKLTSEGPVLYRQRRVGLANMEFTTHKFRTMVADAESKTGPTWARKGDPRMTRIGKILRKTGMDELPQLFDILRGKMSFVGPRPIREVFEREFEGKIPFYSLRHMVKPGLTGWGQVGEFDARSADGPQKRFEHDLFYIHEYSLFLDAFIMLKTLKKVLWARGE